MHTFPSVISSSTSAPQAQRLEEIMLADVVVVVVGCALAKKVVAVVVVAIAEVVVAVGKQ